MTPETADSQASSVAVRIAAGPFLTSAAVALGIALLVHWSGANPEPLTALSRYWDGDHYLYLAQHGYPAGSTPLDAFFPGYPILIALVHLVVPSYEVAAVLVSLAGLALALFFVARLAHLETGSEDEARFATWCLAVFPYAFFLSAVYSDGCLLAATAIALYCARTGRPRAAAIAAAAALSFKVFGLALLPALAYEMWIRRAHWTTYSTLVVPVLPLVAFAAFLGHQTGDWFGFATAARGPAFSLHPEWPWIGARDSLQAATDGRVGPELRAIYGSALAVGLLILELAAIGFLLKLRRSYFLYTGGVLLIALAVSNWRSNGRYMLAAFPVILVVTRLTATRPWLRQPLLAVSTAGMAFLAYTYSMGRWTG